MAKTNDGPQWMKNSETHCCAGFERSNCFGLCTFQAFSKTGAHSTIETKDPLYQRTIGQRVELSFFDLKIVNKAYCAGKLSLRATSRKHSFILFGRQNLPLSWVHQLSFSQQSNQLSGVFRAHQRISWCFLLKSKHDASGQRIFCQLPRHWEVHLNCRCVLVQLAPVMSPPRLPGPDRLHQVQMSRRLDGQILWRHGSLKYM